DACRKTAAQIMGGFLEGSRLPRPPRLPDSALLGARGSACRRRRGPHQALSVGYRPRLRETQRAEARCPDLDQRYRQDDRIPAEQGTRLCLYVERPRRGGKSARTADRLSLRLRHLFPSEPVCREGLSEF